MFNLQRVKYIYKFISFSIFLFLNYTGTTMAYEEPKYDLIKKTDVYEIRSYEDRLAVKTLQTSGEDRAFGRLFKYISGANQSSSKIEMTIPVLKSDEGSGIVMYFFLPKSYSMKTTPLPNANNIELVVVKGGYFAVIKYSGRLTNQNYKRHTTLIKNALNKDRISINGEPIQAIYNGPLTPFFLRRNEAMYRVNLK